MCNNGIFLYGRTKNLIISIGILAHNEGDHIGALIEDLSRQTIFKKSDLRISLHVVANGCSDDTPSVSRKALQAESFQKPHVRTHVEELSKAGKANAWNEFIHALADKNSDYVFLLDADIRLVDDHTLALTLETLMTNPLACVAVGDPLKDVSLKQGKSLLDRLILSFSRTTHDVRTALAGAFYCVRYSTARSIWLPLGIIGEDGFLRAMILTSSFKQKEDIKRLIFVQGARVVFETRRNLRDILHHQIRCAMGTGVNVLLFADLRHQLQSIDSVEDYIKTRNDDDPSWLNSLIYEKMNQGKYFVMNKGFLTTRLKHFLSLPFPSQIVKFPVYALATALDLFVYLAANKKMRSGAATGFW
jgi:glycosyltransferase involved in cell wall biosynthesis